jgi:hypothetical protein
MKDLILLKKILNRNNKIILILKGGLLHNVGEILQFKKKALK